MDKPAGVMELERTAENTGILVDARELSHITNIPISSIWRGCREGVLPHYRFGRTLRFDPNEVFACLRRNVLEGRTN